MDKAATQSSRRESFGSSKYGQGYRTTRSVCNTKLHKVQLARFSSQATSPGFGKVEERTGPARHGYDFQPVTNVADLGVSSQELIRGFPWPQRIQE